MNCFIDTNKIFFAGWLLLVTGLGSCKKFLEIEPPKTSLTEANVYLSDATAISVLTGIYTNLAKAAPFAGIESGISVSAGLSADELTLANVITDQGQLAFYTNQLRTGTTGNYGTQLWIDLFTNIYQCNARIAGLNESTSLTPAVKNQLLGEAKFLRAFHYFYLVNFYGDVPLVLGINPNENAVLPRTAKETVYDQIIADLTAAQNLLNSSFPDATLLKSTLERVRPTKWVATALLARVYLYLGQWANAEKEATRVIANTALFSLPPLTSAFLKNSTEAIWQLQPVQTGRNTEDAMTFVLPPTGPSSYGYPVYLAPQILSAFEAGDLRRKGGNWVDSVIAGGITYFYPAKYKAKNIPGSSFTEYLMIFRLAEQYLIRAEARAQLNNIQGAKDDVNAVRTRARLPNTSANDQASLLTAVLKERQVELFTELGQRWLDLKRTGKINEVMTSVTPLKGNVNGWSSYQQLYPLPFTDIQRNVNLVQNAGY
jgi:starch-binding outer membrane protein, SusD/RagB family